MRPTPTRRSRDPRGLGWLALISLILSALTLTLLAESGQPFSTPIQQAIQQLTTGVTTFSNEGVDTNGYISFGTGRGSSGYGIRDNAGVLEFKRALGGTWTPVPSGGFAPADAGYVTKTTNATLSNEFALGSLATALLLNTTTTGVPTAYVGTTCTNQFIRALSLIGAATCASIVNADVDNAAAIGWTKINKTGSSLADLITRSATDLTSGTLPNARFPATLPVASGANLTNLPAANLTGTIATTVQDLITRLGTLGAGSVGAPSLAIGEATTGLYLSATGVLRITVAATQVARLSVTDQNVGLGVSALSSASLSGSTNTAVGRQALLALTSGSLNTTVGGSTGRALTTQSDNTLIGYGAGDALTASAATMVGSQAGTVATAANDLFGYRAGYRLTTGNGNQFFGASVGSNQLTGFENFAAGFDVMVTGTGGTAQYNTVIGSIAGKDLLSGISNVFLGRAAGRDAVSTNYSTFVGHSAGMHVLGNNNTAVGDVALFALSEDAGTGTYNSAFGSEAAVTETQANSVTTASFTTFLGGQSGFASATQYNGSAAIGYRAKVTGANYLMALGGAVGTGFEVKVGIGTATPTERLHVVGAVRVESGSVGYTSLAVSTTAPTIAAGFCTSPVVAVANGTAAFAITIGTACGAATGTLTLPTATTGWTCTLVNVTSPAANVPAQTGGTTTTATFTNYARTTGLAANWTDSEALRGLCVAY